MPRNQMDSSAAKPKRKRKRASPSEASGKQDDLSEKESPQSISGREALAREKAAKAAFGDLDTKKVKLKKREKTAKAEKAMPEASRSRSEDPPAEDVKLKKREKTAKAEKARPEASRSRSEDPPAEDGKVRKKEKVVKCQRRKAAVSPSRSRSRGHARKRKRRRERSSSSSSRADRKRNSKKGTLTQQSMMQQWQMMQQQMMQQRMPMAYGMPHPMMMPPHMMMQMARMPGSMGGMAADTAKPASENDKDTAKTPATQEDKDGQESKAEAAPENKDAAPENKDGEESKAEAAPEVSSKESAAKAIAAKIEAAKDATKRIQHEEEAEQKPEETATSKENEEAKPVASPAETASAGGDTDKPARRKSRFSKWGPDGKEESSEAVVDILPAAKLVPPPPPVPIANTTKPQPEKLSGEDWEEPRSTTGLKLIGDLAPEGRPWTYLVKDESRRSFVGYLQAAFASEMCPIYFEKARDGLTWYQATGPQGPIPRKTAWMTSDNCSCSYRCKGIEVPPQRFPPWMMGLTEQVMRLCGIKSNDYPNSCEANLYMHGLGSFGWRADDEPLFQGMEQDCRIVSLSLGVARRFDVRLNWPCPTDTNTQVSINLGNGDLCTMEGMCQKHFEHGVPPQIGIGGANITLTWRWITKPPPPPPPPPPTHFSKCRPPAPPAALLPTDAASVAAEAAAALAASDSAEAPPKAASGVLTFKEIRAMQDAKAKAGDSGITLAAPVDTTEAAAAVPEMTNGATAPENANGSITASGQDDAAAGEEFEMVEGDIGDDANACDDGSSTEGTADDDLD